jgi:hypothetical protein
MDGKAFLAPARLLLAQPQEAFWRAATGRAYYALFLEARDTLRRWGFVPAKRDSAHSFVRLRMTYAADPDLHRIGLDLDRFGQLRNKADYELNAAEFQRVAAATTVVHEVAVDLTLLDAVLADPARVAAAVADIRARWP